MIKRKVLPLILSVLMIFAGCAGNDPETRIVGEVNGAPIYAAEVAERAAALQLGLGTESTGETTRAAKKREKENMIAALDTIVEARVLLLLAEEYGTATLSSEEEQAVRASYDAALTAFRQYVEQEFTNSFTSFTEAQVEQGVDMLLEMQGTTREGFLENLKRNRILTATKDAIRANFSADRIDEKTVSERYEQLIREQKEVFESNPSKFEGMYGGLNVVAYVPEGFREVLCVREPYGELDLQIISQLSAQGQKAQAEESAKKAFQSVAEAANKSASVIREQAEAFIESPEAVMPQADVRRMYVCKASTGFTEEELTGIFGMEDCGDVCGPYAGARSGNSYVLVGDMESGAVALEEIRDGVTALAAAEGSEAYLESVMADAMKQYGVKTYKNRF